MLRDPAPSVQEARNHASNHRRSRSGAVLGETLNPVYNTGSLERAPKSCSMNSRSADELAKSVTVLIGQDRAAEAHALLTPVLAQRTPFRLLDRIGAIVGAGPSAAVNPFLDQIASDRTEGGWVIIASALGQQLGCDLSSALSRARAFVVAADVWYGADILGERVPGPALVNDFEGALPLLERWREDENRWVRRTVGVATHFWAKRSRGAPHLAQRAGELLSFLEPMFEESEIDAVKGVGWGLKTLGRAYPHLVAWWLEQQVICLNRRHRALMLRKATTYLPDEQRAYLEAGPQQE